MAGRYFDEWQVGDTVAHAITRTVTETDNLLITTLTHNPQPLHLDYEARPRPSLESRSSTAASPSACWSGSASTTRRSGRSSPTLATTS